MRRREDDLVAWADDPVVRALTATAEPDELAGGEAIFAAYRANTTNRSRGGARVLRRIGGTGVAALVTVAALSGAAAAAYVQVLPDPMQQAVHDIFTPLHTIGVPSPPKPAPAKLNAHRLAHLPHSTTTPNAVHGGRSQSGVVVAPGPSATSSSAATGASPQPSSSPAASASPSPSPSASPQLTVSVSAPKRVGYQRAFAVTGVVRYGADVSANRYVSVWIKRVEDSQWSKLGSTQQTDSDGRVSFSISGFDENTKVQLRTGGGKVHSTVATVVVLPRVSVSVAAAANGTDDLVTVSTAGARPGDVVYLDRKDGSSWTVKVQSTTLDSNGKAQFRIAMPATGSQSYRVRVVYTSVHGTGTKGFALSA
jgi:hypothetical protein